MKRSLNSAARFLRIARPVAFQVGTPDPFLNPGELPGRMERRRILK
ncbi:hypothetical protein [Leptospira adleri]|nr:hypothetical protein [Leptospira adleri]